MSRGRPLLLSKKIFEQLEADIGARLYPPGSHLAEDEIASELGVSRTPVREAFRMLEREGWLEIIPHAGAYVRNPPIDEIRQVFEVRQCLEDRAASLAAVHATEADIDKLHGIIKRGWRQLERSDVKGITALNSLFHAVIAETSRNHILAGMLIDLNKRVRWHLSAVAMIRSDDSWHEHEGIFQAISQHEPERAGQLTVEHNQRIQEAFLHRLVHGDGAELLRSATR